MLIAPHDAGKPTSFGEHDSLADAGAFAALLAPLKRSEWVYLDARETERTSDA
jgi:hypothetical protein